MRVELGQVSGDSIVLTNPECVKRNLNQKFVLFMKITKQSNNFGVKSKDIIITFVLIYASRLG
jgi:hypothetical protein